MKLALRRRFKNFKICYGFLEANDTITHLNDCPGEYDSHILAISGHNGFGVTSSGMRFDIQVGEPLDVTPYEGQKLTFNTSGAYATFVAILPNREWKRVSVRKLALKANESTSLFVEANASILPYVGSLTVDGELIHNLRAATVTKGRTVNITSDEDVSYLVITPTLKR